MERQFIEIQKHLQNKIMLKNSFKEEDIKYAAGIDLAYWNHDDIENAVCCIVVIDYKTKEVVERKHLCGIIGVPYIAGYLAFRELPLIMETVRTLHNRPDIYIFDGNGYLHPRHMGIATQAAFLLNKPTIGVAKSYYKVKDVEFDMPAEEVGSYTDICIDGDVYGRALRTHKNVQPVFVSAGNYIDLNTATNIVKNLVAKESHIPIPTRLADLDTHEERKKCKQQQEKMDSEMAAIKKLGYISGETVKLLNGRMQVTEDEQEKNCIYTVLESCGCYSIAYEKYMSI